jgi:hypothetical protein
MPPSWGEKLQECDYYGNGVFLISFGENDPVDVTNKILTGEGIESGINDKELTPKGKGRQVT